MSLSDCQSMTLYSLLVFPKVKFMNFPDGSAVGEKSPNILYRNTVYTRNESKVSIQEHKTICWGVYQMTINEHPAFSSFHFGIKGQTYDQVFKFLSWDIAKLNPSIVAIDLHERLDDHYRGNTVGIGDGIALFDWKQDLESPILSLARLLTPVAFQTPDDRPVDIVVTLISPESHGSQHLTHLARISRLLRDQDILGRLRTTQSVDGLAAILQNPLPHQIAA